MNLPASIKIVEVGPRDGLQNESKALSVGDRTWLVDALSECGFSAIETGSFVSPQWVPQMADTDRLFQAIRRRPGTVYTALAPNLQGLERAIECKADEVAVFTAASEAFTKKNINMTIAESLERFGEVLRRAREARLRVRGYVSTAWVCPYAGPVAPEAVGDVTKRLLDLGCYEVSLGDTVGAATPAGVERVISLLTKNHRVTSLAVHFHDTRGTALANVLTAMQMGVSVVDSSAGGLGGCPYSPGASGNLATEDLVYMLDDMGVRTGIDLGKLVQVSLRMAEILGKPIRSRYVEAAAAKQRIAAK